MDDIKTLREHIKKLEEENKSLRIELDFLKSQSAVKEIHYHFNRIEITKPDFPFNNPMCDLDQNDLF